MFTGIVTDIGEIVSLTPTGRASCIAYASMPLRRPLNHRGGASIACNGVCLTVVRRGWRRQNWFDVDARRRRSA